MCLRDVRLRVSSSDAIYDTINASTGGQISHNSTTIEGIVYPQAISSCKTSIHEHGWGEIHFHINTTKEDMSRVRARKDTKINHVKINNGDQLTLSINGEENEKICGNDEYSESIATVDKIRDHRNPDYNKLNGGGVRELSEFGMILVSRILYYSVRIR